MNPREEAEKLAASLITEIASDVENYRFLIPDWEPESKDMGLRWLKSQVWEGFYVSYKINKETKVVYLKSWEDEEPNWNELNYKT
jgi:hypothetical protein